MRYKAFTTIEQVEPFFGHSIYKDGKEMTVVGSNYDEKSKILYIQAVDENGKESSMPATNWFYSAKYKGHQFGEEVR